MSVPVLRTVGDCAEKSFTGLLFLVILTNERKLTKNHQASKAEMRFMVRSVRAVVRLRRVDRVLENHRLCRAIMPCNQLHFHNNHGYAPREILIRLEKIRNIFGVRDVGAIAEFSCL